jgi:hypothetical protein
VSNVRNMLRDDFQLRFRVANAAKIKYNDMSFDEKRVWISRLLAQFLMSGVIIVSIDESSFKKEGVTKQYWQPSSKTIKQVFNQAPFRQDVASQSISVEESKQAPTISTPTKPAENKEVKISDTPVNRNSIGLTPVQ